MINIPSGYGLKGALFQTMSPALQRIIEQRQTAERELNRSIQQSRLQWRSMMNSIEWGNSTSQTGNGGNQW